MAWAQAFWQPIECPGIEHSILRPEDPILTESRHHWVCPEHATPSLLLLVLADEFIENPLSGKGLSAQLVFHPPGKMATPPSPKTVD